MYGCNNCQFECIAFKQDNTFIGNCTDRSGNMCKFCENKEIVKMDKMRTTMIKVKDINVLCCAHGDKNFAGALIVNYCPMCGKDLRRE